jgi:hypothetical protein
MCPLNLGEKSGRTEATPWAVGASVGLITVGEEIILVTYIQLTKMIMSDYFTHLPYFIHFTVSEDNRCPGRNSKEAPPEYKYRTLPIHHTSVKFEVF